MQFLALLSLLLLPVLSLTSPLASRQANPCVPTQYVLKNYIYDSSPSFAGIHIDFQSYFSDLSIITDPASAGASCDMHSTDGTIPLGTEIACSTGRRNFYIVPRGPLEDGDFQLIHTYQCKGQTWMSSTHYRMDAVCMTPKPKVHCTAPDHVFQAENVRQICSTPTCPP